MNPRFYYDYHPKPNRTLDQPRTWPERVLDLRHAAGLALFELSVLTQMSIAALRDAEHHLGKPFHPTLRFILAIRKMEAIFKEEIERYLRKPHRRLNWRQNPRRKLVPYGGYKAISKPRRRIRHRTTVSFGGVPFEDIGKMGDLEAIRALKGIKPFDFDAYAAAGYVFQGRRSYVGITEAASRGHFMSPAELERVMGHDPETPAGQPVAV